MSPKVCQTFFFSFNIIISGLQSLAHDLNYVTEFISADQQALHQWSPISGKVTKDEVFSSTKEYIRYKMSYAKLLQFSPVLHNLSTNNGPNTCKTVFFFLLSAAMVDPAPLEAVYIYFNTATYDEIERDVKVMLGHNMIWQM